MAASSDSPAARALWWVGIRSGFMAAVAGVCAAVVVSVLCWLPDAGVSGKPASAIRAGLLSFLAAHHGGITVDGVGANFLPLGMFLGVVAFCWRAGTTIAQAVDEAGDEPAQRVVTALALSALTYTAVCGLLVPLARLGSSHVPEVTTVIAAFLVFGLAAGTSLARRTDLLTSPAARLPAAVVTAARGAGAAAAVYLAAGALLSAGSLVLHVHRVLQLSREVGGGFSGLPVLVISLLCAPNAAVAGSAYLAGPGFAIGSGTTVNAFSTSHGVLPALPILGAVPGGNGANPVVLSVMGLVAVAAAVCSARCVRRIGPVGFWRQAGGALLAGAICGPLLGAICWLGGGAAGSGRLHVVGASPWQVGVAVAIIVGGLGLLAVCVLSAWDLVVRSIGSHDDDPVAAGGRELARSGAR
jgi:hypothetical protein